MTKKYLKSGMVVERRDGKLFLVVGDYITNCEEYELLKAYKNDLRCKGMRKDYDIIKVYKNYASTLKSAFEKEYLILLWEKTEDLKNEYI